MQTRLNKEINALMHGARSLGTVRGGDMTMAPRNKTHTCRLKQPMFCAKTHDGCDAYLTCGVVCAESGFGMRSSTERWFFAYRSKKHAFDPVLLGEERDTGGLVMMMYSVVINDN